MKNILQRFVDVWKVDFLLKFFTVYKDDNKTTILFWVSFNFLVVIVLCVYLCISFYGVPDNLIETIEKNIPDGARIAFVDGQMNLENIDTPFFREIKVSNKQANYDDKFAVIIDLEGNEYDITSLDEYSEGILVLRDRLYSKNNNEINQLLFKDVPNISFSKTDAIDWIDKYLFFPFFAIAVIFIGLVLFIIFALLRLIIAFWWSLMLFVLTRIVGLRVDFITTYKAVLNLYVIPTVVMLVFDFAGFRIPLLTTVIFLTVFIANLIWIIRQKRIFIKDSVELVVPSLEDEVI